MGDLAAKKSAARRRVVGTAVVVDRVGVRLANRGVEEGEMQFFDGDADDLEDLSGQSVFRESVCDSVNLDRASGMPFDSVGACLTANDHPCFAWSQTSPRAIANKGPLPLSRPDGPVPPTRAPSHVGDNSPFWSCMRCYRVAVA